MKYINKMLNVDIFSESLLLWKSALNLLKIISFVFQMNEL